MTLRGLYAAVDGNYDDAVSRLMNERLAERFVLKFPSDPSMRMLTDAVEAGDIQASFRAAHTLKGVAANLSFSRLAEASSALTEQLRPRGEKADRNLYEAVLKAYKRTVDAILLYGEQKA